MGYLCCNSDVILIQEHWLASFDLHKLDSVCVIKWYATAVLQWIMPSPKHLLEVDRLAVLQRMLNMNLRHVLV